MTESPPPANGPEPDPAAPADAMHFADTLPPRADPTADTLFKPGLPESMPAARDQPHTSAAVPGYELLSELGRGGMGVVYKARQIQLKRVVALKMILCGPHAGTQDRERFQREAEAIASLHHPHIVQVYEIGEHDDRPFFSMEFVEGCTLQQKLTGTPQPARPAAQLVEVLAQAVHVAHQHGIVHRDLKPGNILLETAGSDHSVAIDDNATTAVRLFGTPKITDFGLAKRLDGDGTQTRTGDILGTPSYMAPEQADGRVKQIGPATDVYALGAILYELLTGRPPFRAATAIDTVWQVLNEEPVAPGRLAPKLPRDLERICLKCLAKDPTRRYASAQELADDLRRHLQGEPVHARPPGRIEQIWRWSRRNPVPASLLLAVTLGAAFGLWYLSRLSQSLVHSAALESAAQQSGVLDDVNTYYSSVISHMQGIAAGRHPGVDVVPAWKTLDKPALPPPATLTIELGQAISQGQSGVHVRLYSDYPFKTRTDGGPHDEFEREALVRLREDPRQPFYSFEEYQGRPVLRYATARLMKRSCLHCHNTEPNSTKHDWREGDVRGVLEIIRPIDRDEARVQTGLRGTFILVAVVAGVLLTLSGLVLFLSNRRRRAPRLES